MVEAFAMIAGTALEYGVKMLAWLKKKKTRKERFRTFHKVDVLYFLLSSFI